MHTQTGLRARDNIRWTARLYKAAPRAALIALGLVLLTAPAWPQQSPPGATIPSCTPPTGSGFSAGGDFFTNFVNNVDSAAYQISLPSSNASTAAGDLNSTYYTMYYSVANASLVTNGGDPATSCPLELILVGNFPDSRYFSIAINDMHYSLAQHIADLDIDPVNTNVTAVQNPFVIGGAGQTAPYTSPQYDGSQPFVVPISLGLVPNGTTNGCQIDPYEGDNLLDATQRHLSVDWNTSYSTYVLTDLSGPLPAHLVDTPSHPPITVNAFQTPGQNTAGDIVVRHYLAPPYSCPGAASSCVSQAPAGQAPFLMIRDANTGCAYPMLDAENNPTAYFQALVSTPNATAPYPVLSEANPTGGGDTYERWLDLAQFSAHQTFANTTPQVCFANGQPQPPTNNPYTTGQNEVAWTRVSNWESLPSPDDSYIGGAVPYTDLQNMPSGTAECPNGCLLEFNFQLPNTPDTPCASPFNCELTSSPAADMRYMSLTFWYKKDSTGQDTLDLDGLVQGQNCTQNCSSTLVSLADPAFAQNCPGGSSPCYASLIVNTALTEAELAGLPTSFQQPANLQPCSAAVLPCGVTKGVEPQTVSVTSGETTTTYYTVWRNSDGYTVLDLTLFSGFESVFGNGDPGDYSLLLTFRNTLPSSTFKCSGFAVPYNMAEYTNSDGAGGGLMGPYVPQVSVVLATNPALGSAPTFGGLPSASSCGVIPTATTPTTPGANSPTISAMVNFPLVFWPNGSAVPPNLVCGSTINYPAAQIYFAATQYTSPALTYFLPQGSQCKGSNATNGCSQIVIQATQTTELPPGNPDYPWQPPLAVAITGTGFGFLPLTATATQPYVGQGRQPYVGQASALMNTAGTQSVLTISDNGCSSPSCSSAWTTDPADPSIYQSSCQVYVAEWNDSNIWLFLNLPVNVQDGYLAVASFAPTTYLSPLSDVAWWPFQAVAPGQSPTGCPVGYTSQSQFDTLTFLISNPETGSTASVSVGVSPTNGTTLN